MVSEVSVVGGAYLLLVVGSVSCMFICCLQVSFTNWVHLLTVYIIIYGCCKIK